MDTITQNNSKSQLCIMLTYKQKIINLVEKLKIPLNSSNLKYDTFTLCYIHYYEYF